MNLKPDGERLILEHYGCSVEDHLIRIMHIAAYKFAEKFSQGKRVLDYGCGSGYGSAWIAEKAKRVYAVDVSEEAIRYAQNHHRRRNLNYLRVAPEKPLPFPNKSFDTVLSFQVFEHLFNTGHYLSEIHRLLCAGGRLILVTPDRKTRLLPLQQPWNRWHIYEYSAPELDSLLRSHFQDVQIWHMSSRKDIVNIEIRRCRKRKWLTLPFTLPFIPNFIRLGMLNLLHTIRPYERLNKPVTFDFYDSDIIIAKDAHPSLNLVALAQNPKL